MLSSRQAAGRGIRMHCGASCPFGSLDRGVCGLVVGDDTACCPRLASIPVGRLPLPATPPPAAPVARRPRLPSRWTAVVGLAAVTELCCYIVEALLLDSRVVDVPMSSNAIVVTPLSWNTLFFNGLKNGLRFSEAVGV